LDPTNKLKYKTNQFKLLHGLEYLKKQIKNIDIQYYPFTFYPRIFESYNNLNLKLAQLIKKDAADRKCDNKNILIDINANEGAIGILTADIIDNYYTICDGNSSSKAVYLNINNNSHLKSDYHLTFPEFGKIKKSLASIMSRHADDETLNVTVIIQSEYFKKRDKYFKEASTFHH
jgi:hypothetical protein